MQTIAGFDFYPLHYDANGNLSDAGEFSALTQGAAAATDVVLLAHGFRNDENDATGLYTRFLTSFAGQVGRSEFHPLAARKIIAGGVFWPSKSYQETFPADAGGVQAADPAAAQVEAVREKLRELQSDVTDAQRAAVDEAISLLPQLEQNPATQDRFVSLVLSILPEDGGDGMEGLELVRSQSGSDLLSLLRRPVVVPVRRAAAGDSDSAGAAAAVGVAIPVARDEGGVEGLSSMLGSVLGAAGKFANLTTWYQMKSRSGLVGETGVARAVRGLKAAGIKVHLVGHSLGGRLMASCARALTQDPMVQPDSMTLLEAAFSHFGFSPNNGLGQPGFFRDVIAKRVVKGPLLETFSAQDTVVAYVYAIASRVAGDNTRAIGDANDPFGGIGRNGAQKTPESAVDVLHDVGIAYAFKSGIVNNLDGSGGLITSHGDVTNDRVTYAFASAMLAA